MLISARCEGNMGKLSRMLQEIGHTNFCTNMF